MKMYGHEKPSEYDLSKVKLPVATFYADDDELCRPEDVIRLTKSLPNVIGEYAIHHEDFAHLDFLLGKDVNEIVYKDVFEILSRYKD